MTQPLSIRPEAEQDMIEGRDWYENQREGLGTEFLTAVEEVFDCIRETPDGPDLPQEGARREGIGEPGAASDRGRSRALWWTMIRSGPGI